MKHGHLVYIICALTLLIAVEPARGGDAAPPGSSLSRDLQNLERNLKSNLKFRGWRLSMSSFTNFKTKEETC